MRNPDGVGMPRVALISDTHGMLRPEAKSSLYESDFIVHAGDIGRPAVLEGLSPIAPVTAVRGNNDRGVWADAVPAFEVLRVDDVLMHVPHDLAELDPDPVAAGFG
jgi:uncharacterized protein